MEFHVKTKNIPTNIHLTLTALSPVVVFIVVFDPSRRNTDYIFREKLVERKTEVDLKLPFSPENVDILIYDAMEANAQTFDVIDLKALPMPRTPKLCVDILTKQFIDFAVRFAQIQGYSKPGIYRDKAGIFKIELLDDITSNGRVVKTPYRIHCETSVIQASKKQCETLTVSSRIALLLHEYSHNFLSADPDSEFEADQHALEIYTALELPNVEGLYAFSRIFHANEESADRLQQILSYLE